MCFYYCCITLSEFYPHAGESVADQDLYLRQDPSDHAVHHLQGMTYKSKDWSIANTKLYLMAFTGQATQSQSVPCLCTYGAPHALSVTLCTVYCLHRVRV